MVNQPPGRLYVVATPIGNLGDFSTRARDTLVACARIAAEDTRHTGTLLKAFNIETPMISMHDHNESLRAPEIVQRLREGEDVALVSDAGTPAISDPGFEVVRAAAAAGIEIIAVPGPCAAIAALCIAALPTHRFCFEGFLPARGAARRARLETLATEMRTMVFYESPHRIVDMLEDCAQAFGDARTASLVREATKLHESVYRGPLHELFTKAVSDADVRRGELVLVVAGRAEPDPAELDADPALDRTLGVLLEEVPLKQAARLAARLCRVRDNEAYRRALKLKDG